MKVATDKPGFRMVLPDLVARARPNVCRYSHLRSCPRPKVQMSASQDSEAPDMGCFMSAFISFKPFPFGGWKCPFLAGQFPFGGPSPRIGASRANFFGPVDGRKRNPTHHPRNPRKSRICRFPNANTNKPYGFNHGFQVVTCGFQMVSPGFPWLQRGAVSDFDFNHPQCFSRQARVTFVQTVADLATRSSDGWIGTRVLQKLLPKNGEHQQGMVILLVVRVGPKDLLPKNGQHQQGMVFLVVVRLGFQKNILKNGNHQQGMFLQTGSFRFFSFFCTGKLNRVFEPFNF